MLVKHRTSAGIVGTRMTYATHPFDVVGWDGCLYPYTFNIDDYMPITGKIHQPPPVHQVFEGWNFVICNFLPRKVDYHPLAVPVPYYHSNVDSDEVMFYVGGDYEARKGSGINVGSISLHPGGHAHGPQPSAIEASLGAEFFDESAVMVDTFAPLDLGEAGIEAEDPAYAWTWAGRGPDGGDSPAVFSNLPPAWRPNRRGGAGLATPHAPQGTAAWNSPRGKDGDMSRKPPHQDIDESDLEVEGSAHAAAGVTAVAVSMKRSIEQMGVARTARTLLRLNQADGFDCQGCAWPDPDPEHRHTAEFCENGAKAVTEEATLRRVEPDFFAQHSLAELREKTDYWLGQQGRLTHPMVKRAGATHYEPITWGAAFALMARHLNGLASPDEAVFYTSGKTSNEAAFAYQLFARAFGTNNLPDCSNMCHESTSVGARRGDRHRQGLGQPRRHPRGEADRDRRPEPGHQPPADADRAGDRQAERREDHRGQPAARGRPGALQEPPDGARRRRPRHRARRPAPAGAGQR